LPQFASVFFPGRRGLLAIEWLLGYGRRHTSDVFVVYRLVASALVVAASVSGLRDATF